MIHGRLSQQDFHAWAILTDEARRWSSDQVWDMLWAQCTRNQEAGFGFASADIVAWFEQMTQEDVEYQEASRVKEAKRLRRRELLAAMSEEDRDIMLNRYLEP